MSIILSLKEIKKDYNLSKNNQVHALQNITVDINAGDFISIMGPSGSGKSTLLHMVGLLDRPTSGDIIIEDHNIMDLSNKDMALLRRKKIGFVFQNFNLLPRLSALRNVIMPALYAHTPRAEAVRDAKNLLKRVGLARRMKHKSNELSGGEKQRVAIARALMNDPDIILADEPTGNLDSKSGQEIMKLFGELHRGGKTIIIVTHDHEVAENTNHTIELKDGKILTHHKNK